VAAVLFGSAAAKDHRIGRVTHDGTVVSVGETVTGGTLQFADGSVAGLSDDLQISIVSSVQRSDGTYYTILRVPVGAAGAIGLSVNPSSRFEVVTPAAVAGSMGTVYYVVVPEGGGNPRAGVYVTQGKVRVTSRGAAQAEQVVARDTAVVVDTATGTIDECEPRSLRDLVNVNLRSLLKTGDAGGEAHEQE
jgi:hypothetical protein